MKKIFCVTTLVAASLGLSAGASAADGQVNFEGQIITEACQVVNNMSNPAEVALGKVAASALAKKGDTASPQKFILSLKNCPPSVSAAQVSFDGDAATSENNSLALTQVADMATGVGVQISDTSAVLPLRTPSVAYPLTAGVDNDLAFVARYVATTDTVTPGPANAVATFSITYN
ncbi:fimbrial protein [Serratia oryzae]|uniref:fimbrial protein n=1 Tax=Serratia oryzae TaxID=2034155 RepID=UPI0012F14D8B|nr:fimbrial protein [Serratia oryzae]VXC92846.1 major type 1 subunit fimbrin (pilin) [Enterobacterales bacterium 8AC]